LVNNSSPKFRHGGSSTSDLLNSARVLKAIGIKSGDIFLDAGCGDGYISMAAAEIAGAQGRVYALDIEEPTMADLKQEISTHGIKNMEALAADITRKTPLASQSLDICLMASVLHGFVENKEVDSVMKEVNRVIKPGATLAIVEFKKLENIPGPPIHIKLSPEQVAGIIAPYGYRQKQVAEVGKFHYAILFEKD
jgi:ubiquinone/menaquinone biosynthesis C-methylase UbiE